MTVETMAPCPVVVSVNFDVETLDAQVAGAAGLFGRYSYGRYGAREGLWRILNALEECGVRATFFVPADEAKRHRSLLMAIVAGGHEIAAQGAPVFDKLPEGPADLALLARTKAALADVIGIEPKGWRSTNGLLTVETMLELADLGFLYDSTFQDDDRPYAFSDGKGRTLVELPVWDYLSDSTFYAPRHSHLRVQKVWTEEFAAMYAAGAYVPLTLHSRGDIGSSRPVRVQVMADFLRHMASHPGVHFYRADELAALVAQTAVAEPIPGHGEHRA
ncbi:polysaccharide deacetylase family protein [Ottowia thiooxydans]|uniref:polysaccharide deacetylase family protein n=1 Tax=Ottowia thiooxydans TaxID=219182 RepID=UPI000409CA4E|nr:polysaccharide deacetylase family protein [Ottowia thiooxydans]